MKRKILLATILSLFIAVPAFAGVVVYSLRATPYPVLVNGAKLNTNLPVMTYKANGGNNTYVPLKAVLDAMGAKTSWDGKKVNVQTNKWDVERLNEYLNTQYSVLVVKADLPGNMISQGSGFAVLDGSYIVTNAHVVQGDKVVHAKNFIEKAYYDYKVVLKDSGKDIAILKSITRQYNYTPLKLGNSDKTKTGDGVVAFGHPYDDEIQCPTSTGKVTKLKAYNGMKLIENSTFTSPGSSGGALLNDDGEVVGVTSGGTSDLSNVSIPINEVKKLLNTLN